MRLYIIKPLLCPIIAFFWIFCLIMLSLRDGNSHGQRHHVLDCLSYSGQLNISGMPLGEFLQMFTQIWTQEWTSLESVSKMSPVKIIVPARPSYSSLRTARGGGEFLCELRWTLSLVLSLRWLMLHHVAKLSVSPLCTAVKIACQWRRRAFTFLLSSFKVHYITFIIWDRHERKVQTWPEHGGIHLHNSSFFFCCLFPCCTHCYSFWDKNKWPLYSLRKTLAISALSLLYR